MSIKLYEHFRYFLTTTDSIPTEEVETWSKLTGIDARPGIIFDYSGNDAMQRRWYFRTEDDLIAFKMAWY